MSDESPKPSGPAGEPKIHVDSDWKKEAQAEKERLAREAERGAEAPAAAGAEARRELRIPEASFRTLVQMLATQALVFLSDEHDPETGESLQNIELAKHYIDLLAVVEEKTQGRLDEGERRLLDTLLYELRMAYVSAAQ